MLLNENLRLLLFSSNFLILFLLFAMLFMVEIGWRIGAHLSSKYSAKKVDASETFLAAIFGLLALLIAFTFSGAFERFDNRRELIALEVSATGTAYQYVDLLATKDQQKVRELFSDYLDSRINLYQGNHTLSEMHLEKKVAAHNAIGSQLWKAVVLIVENTAYPQKAVTAQILPKVSDMFTASENQRLASKFHPPEIIWQALLILSFIGSLVAGYNMGIEKKRDWLVVIIFSILMAGTIFIIFSLEYPRIGKVSLVDFEAELMILRKSF
jgi:hypothetical protein